MGSQTNNIKRKQYVPPQPKRSIRCKAIII